MNTTFYRLLICQIVTLFANAALRFALPLYLLRKTGCWRAHCMGAFWQTAASSKRCWPF